MKNLNIEENTIPLKILHAGCKLMLVLLEVFIKSHLLEYTEMMNY